MSQMAAMMAALRVWAFCCSIGHPPKSISVYEFIELKWTPLCSNVKLIIGSHIG